MTVTIPSDEAIVAFSHEHDVVRRHAAQFYADMLPYLASIRRPEREVLTVLAHDEQGRILKTEKKRVPAFNGALHLDYLAHRDFNAGIEAFEEHDKKFRTRYSAYLSMVLSALGTSEGFVSRLATLRDAKDASVFWSAVDSWHGFKRVEARVWARNGQRLNAMREQQAQPRLATEAELETHNTMSIEQRQRYTSITS